MLDAAAHVTFVLAQNTGLVKDQAKAKACDCHTGTTGSPRPVQAL